MKTTLDLPDSLVREVKSRAALQGRTMRVFVIEALQKTLSEGEVAPSEAGWRKVFGKANRNTVDEVQKIVDDEFSRIEEKEWQ